MQESNHGFKSQEKIFLLNTRKQFLKICFWKIWGRIFDLHKATET